ncbi:MAG TPA: M2 family metallopeptidase [Thermoanaerobaculia bacterium]|nr:M2 family metallopeptidase [Thermoanaerobaculia bacterium]
MRSHDRSTASFAEATARELDATLERDLEPLEIASNEAAWEAEVTGAPEAFQRVEELRARVMTRLANRDELRRAEEILAAGEDAVPPSIRRQVLRWRNRLAANQVDAETIARLARDEAELAQQYNGFRADLDGRSVTDNEIDRILLEDRSSAAVEAAWRASKAISRHRGEDGVGAVAGPSVAERLRDLVRLRNAAARQIGFDNAYRANLELGEMSQDWLYQTLDLLERETRPPFQAYKRELDSELARRFAIEPAELRPWHYRDRFFQTPPPVGDEDELDRVLDGRDIVALATESFDQLGFDIRPIVGRSDLYPGDPETSKRCQHAFCMSVDAPRDVRILCNITPGKRWMGTTLHELGHGIYAASLDPELPFVLRDDPHTLCNEAIALLMERHLHDAGWLERVLGLSPEEARAIEENGRRRLAVRHLVFTRWVLVMCHFERALYENPDRDDLGVLWWDLVERFQEIRRPSPRRYGAEGASPDHRDDDWAAKIHFVGHPAYYQNYLIGEVFGAQLEHALAAECGGFAGNRDAGAFLRDRMFRPGATRSWRDLIAEISGKPLDPSYYLATLERGGPVTTPLGSSAR